MKLKKSVAIIMAAILIMSMSGCGDSDSDSDNSSSVTALDISDMFTDRDKEIGYDESESIQIKLNDASAECSSNSVSISGSTVTISDEGTYILSGTLSNGQVIVDAQNTDKIQLVLNGVTINCNTSAAIYVKQADKVFITLAADAENTLSNSEEFVAIDDNNIDAVIFSKDDLTINGPGSLTINAVYGHGIVSKDDFVITGGTYSITSEKKGISANDSIRIADGSITINSGTDGLHAENTDDDSLGFIYVADGEFNINSTTDAFDSSSTLQIDGGAFEIVTGGGSANASTTQDGSVNETWGKWEGGFKGGGGKGMLSDMDPPDRSMNLPQAAIGQSSLTVSSLATSSSVETSDTDTSSAKGLKADSMVLINNGEISIDSSDDAIHSNGNVQIVNGTIDITSGDDGVHADSNLTISGGTLNITKSYEGIEGQIINITGGNINVVASDDGLNAAGGNDQSSVTGRPGQNSFSADEDAYISISGGTTYVNASGDGIDSNGNLTVSGGEVYVSGSKDGGNGALDYEGEATVSGGIVVAAGAGGMAQNFGGNSTQGSMMVNISSQSAETRIELKDSSGNTIASYTPPKEYSCVVVSCPDLKEGENYTLVCGTIETSVTMDSLIYGNGGGMGNMVGDAPNNRKPF